MTKWSEHVHRFAKRHKMTYRESQKKTKDVEKVTGKKE